MMMKTLRHDVLTCPTLPENQDGGIRGSDLLDESPEIFHESGRANQHGVRSHRPDHSLQVKKVQAELKQLSRPDGPSRRAKGTYNIYGFKRG